MRYKIILFLLSFMTIFGCDSNVDNENVYILIKKILKKILQFTHQRLLHMTKFVMQCQFFPKRISRSNEK